MSDSLVAEKNNVLLFAETNSCQLLLKQKLSKDFLLETAENISALEHLLNTLSPQIVLIEKDIAITEDEKVVELIKNDNRTRDIPIIYISPDETTEETIINNITCKSCHDDDLVSQIKLTISFHEKIREQNQVIDETRQMAFSAMSQSGEIGQILHFMRDSFECDTLTKLGERILESMENQCLNTVVRFHTQPPVYFSHEGEIARLDKEILDRLHILERIIDFGIRSLYNFNHVSLLIKNMPLDEPDRYGRIKDNVCLILEAADAKVVAINNEAAIRIRDNSITRVIESSKQTLKEIETAFQNNATKNTEIMLKLKEKIEWSFLQLGLNEDQEHEIAEIIQQAEKESSGLYETGLRIEDRLTKLNLELSEITNHSKAT